MKILTSKQEDFILEQAREKDFERNEARALLLIKEGEVTLEK